MEYIGHRNNETEQVGEYADNLANTYKLYHIWSQPHTEFHCLQLVLRLRSVRQTTENKAFRIVELYGSIDICTESIK
jgi:hypothetical protein